LKKDTLFVDIYTPLFDSIDQHIPIGKNLKSFSPNNVRGIYAFENYKRKYPFSTYFWLLCIAAKDNLDISLCIPKLYEIKTDNIFHKSDILFRADDSLLNCKKFEHNANDWMNYLLEYSNNNKTIKKLFDFMKTADINQIEIWKQNIDTFFKTKCEFNNEEITNISNIKAKKFLSRFNISYNKITRVIQFKNKRVNISSFEDYLKINSSYKLFSYAFVYSSYNRNKKNFSFTYYD